MASIYELTYEQLLLQQMLEDTEDGAEAEQIIKDSLEAVSGEYDIKAEGYAKVIKNLEAQAKAIKDEEDRLSHKREVIEANIKRMKDAIFNSMKALGKPRAGGSIFTLTIQKNGGKLPLLLNDGLTTKDIPERFTKVTVDFDNAAIREALDNGEALKFAKYGERGEGLRIK